MKQNFKTKFKEGDKNLKELKNGLKALKMLNPNTQKSMSDLSKSQRDSMEFMLRNTPTQTILNTNSICIT